MDKIIGEIKTLSFLWIRSRSNFYTHFSFIVGFSVFLSTPHRRCLLLLSLRFHRRVLLHLSSSIQLHLRLSASVV
ncbi:hypothetical protein QVD17_37935 [Tagetes erecta]|uniref:Uncharacterized protein n=1 Tax=Tagetes erecta TaxID=13708 RepID=A0AAD8JZA2_TARER|nr:hypothetical protein QVD17_37935 [Tagetes erecta]